MPQAAHWKKSLDQLAGTPWTFVTGIWHPLKKGYSCPFHSHPGIELVYHPSGHGFTRTKKRRLDFQAGHVVIYGAGETHDQVVHSDGEDLCVQIAPPARVRHGFSEGFLVPPIEQPWLIEEIQQLCRSRAQPGAWEQRILNYRATAVLLALVDFAADASRKNSLPLPERHVLKAEHYIGIHFPKLDSLQDVARHVGLGMDHLRHVFKQQRGKSIIQHLNEVKVGRAKTLLSSSPFPLKQIATLCGFRDEYYFSAVFKRLTHMSPGEYRRSLTPQISRERTTA